MEGKAYTFEELEKDYFSKNRKSWDKPKEPEIIVINNHGLTD